jgi:hypothetical protein
MVGKCTKPIAHLKEIKKVTFVNCFQRIGSKIIDLYGNALMA